MNDMKSRASGALTRRLTAGVCVLAVGLALVGCTTPEPEPVGTPSEIGTPTPTWDAEQVRAIDALQRYIDVASEIGQNLYTADWNQIYEVAADPLAASDVFNWSDWKTDGLHLDGAPVITVESVVPGYSDSQTRHYHVTVCYDRTNAHLINPDGTQMAGRLADRSLFGYTVAITKTGSDLVFDVTRKDGTC